MRRVAPLIIIVVLAGCAHVPPLENPVLVRPNLADAENPVMVAPGRATGASYAEVYERVLNALDDDFDLKPTTRYGDTISTFPRVAPGYEQPWKQGSPDPRERLLATLQSVRHTATVQIQDGERGGYRVYVEVLKELEDIPQPMGVAALSNPATGATFREAPTVDRRPELIEVGQTTDKRWIPVGRDFAYEQKLLKKIQSACSRCRN